jgi:hypothetical protein
MRLVWGLIAASTWMTPAAAKDAAPNPPEQFAKATATCFKALAAPSPRAVLSAVEADKWKLQKATALGGLFQSKENSLILKIETILVSRVCTVLGNRNPDSSLADFSASAETSLRSALGTELTRKENSSDFTLISERKYMAVISAPQGNNDHKVDTQITTIENQ